MARAPGVFLVLSLLRRRLLRSDAALHPSVGVFAGHADPFRFDERGLLAANAAFFPNGVTATEQERYHDRNLNSRKPAAVE